MLTSTNQPWFISYMPKKTYINTTIDSELLVYLKVLAAQQGKRINQFLEEGIKILFSSKFRIPTSHFKACPLSSVICLLDPVT